MKLLVTAGNTQVPIDSVRCITNIFTGRTGALIALEGYHRGHSVTLLTSHPEAVNAVACTAPIDGPHWECIAYRTYDHLDRAMRSEILGGTLDAVIHCAAVSDYRATGTFAPAPDTRLDPANLIWQGQPPTFVDRAAGKIKSDEPELWLRLTRTPKLIDCIRRDWGFKGVLVKFKLEVDITDVQLLAIAERSRLHSSADCMVANTLEGAQEWAFLGSAAGYERVRRHELAARLLDAVEKQHGEKRHG
jgi:phosphopantothenate-cysteine ligase/phosphopantothenoylcysteine decarboxylase/phosphopantothenate--cysteine ligase